MFSAWPHRLTVRTGASQAPNRGSIPREVTNLLSEQIIVDHINFVQSNYFIVNFFFAIFNSEVSMFQKLKLAWHRLVLSYFEVKILESEEAKFYFRFRDEEKSEFWRSCAEMTAERLYRYTRHILGRPAH